MTRCGPGASPPGQSGFGAFASTARYCQLRRQSPACRDFPDTRRTKGDAFGQSKAISLACAHWPADIASVAMATLPEITDPPRKRPGRKPGCERIPGSGRKPGVKNKVPRDLKEMILARG